MGTASDRYAGWVGQIYTAERYRGRVTARTHRVGGRSFKEEVLPVESVEEYFEHFGVLEIDYTFYAPLMNTEGAPTPTFRILEAYGRHLRADDHIILKVPQAICARKIMRGGRYVPNADFLDSQLFTRCFYEPAVQLLGSRLIALIFEQEYQRREEQTPPEELAERLESFFRTIPADPRYHLELRTERYLSKPVFAVMERHGVGQVLSHWTWLPPLGRQLARAGGLFFNSSRQAIVRLMTPRGTRYEEAYARAHPFHALVEGLFQPGMIDDTLEVLEAALSQDVKVHLIINNRSGGNAPHIARMIARRFLEQGHPPRAAST
ncbi:MAG: DUF72 domain-containing protein [Syntrophobacteraceae bacterium]|jgi:uncharacterized protein YecE (DUF72 family)|nr:DUF72 domain-containing protein [Syntrophobacteraceae bacterium]